jgi:general secretion pathway protein B
MSFILDALKKSEKERQRDAIPGISDLPMVVQQTRAPAWIIATIAGLGLCVVVLSWAWWRSASPTTEVASSPTPSERPIQSPSRAAVMPTASQSTTRSLADEATQAKAADSSPAQASPNESQVPLSRIAPVSPPKGGMTPGPMSILEARAAGTAVPELTLELLVFSSNPAQRFVYINSMKYVEGESLADGPRLVEITPEGAILNYRGTDFLLPQN